MDWDGQDVLSKSLFIEGLTPLFLEVTLIETLQITASPQTSLAIVSQLSQSHKLHGVAHIQ